MSQLKFGPTKRQQEKEAASSSTSPAAACPPLPPSRLVWRVIIEKGSNTIRQDCKNVTTAKELVQDELELEIQTNAILYPSCIERVHAAFPNLIAADGTIAARERGEHDATRLLLLHRAFELGTPTPHFFRATLSRVAVADTHASSWKATQTATTIN